MKTVKDLLAVKTIRLLARAQSWVQWVAFGEAIWVSTDGTPHRYGDLKDSHLHNILNLMRRRGEEGTDVYKRLRAEQESRPMPKRNKRDKRRWA
jgi:hypothetical protein